MKRSLAVVFCALLLFLLMSCQAKTELPLPTATSVVVQPGAYPAPKIESPTYPIGEGESKPATQITPNPPADAPEPEPGKASISGVLYSPTSKMVIPGTQFYLTPGWGTDKREVPPAFLGPQVADGDIDLRSDSQGNFSANNIPPGNYYLAVWAPLTWDIAQISETDAQPLLLEIKPDQKYVYGFVYIPWP